MRARTQVIVVSHAGPLVDALRGEAGCAVYTLEKELGETVVRDIESPRWEWPAR